MTIYESSWFFKKITEKINESLVLPFIHPINQKTLKVLNLKGLISHFAVWTGLEPYCNPTDNQPFKKHLSTPCVLNLLIFVHFD